MPDIFNTNKLSKFKLDHQEPAFGSRLLSYIGLNNLFRVDLPEAYSNAAEFIVSFDYTISAINRFDPLSITIKFRPLETVFNSVYASLFSVFESDEKHNIKLFFYNEYGVVIQIITFHGCFISSLTSSMEESDNEIIIEINSDYFVDHL